MRTLTIKREKSVVACTAKMKVYIEDPIQSDLQIGGVPCRKLGDLKNGEEKTFQIGSNAAKVFVIADMLSKEYSNDYYPLPYGDEPVRLTGKNHYDLRAGHPFRFDGVTDESALANRKKGNKTGTLVLIAAVIVGILLGVGRVLLRAEPTDPKDFTVDNMTITLTEAFDEEEYGDFDQCYESRDVAVFVLKEPFSLMDGLKDYTLTQYGNLVVQGNDLDKDALKTENGITYFSYTAEGSNSDTTYYYFAAVYKGPDAFWLIQFAVDQNKIADYQDEFFQWAASVTFE